MKKTTAKKAYGIKAYGTWHYFATKTAYREYLMDWICNTEGAEQERAVTALANLDCGINFTDTASPNSHTTKEKTNEDHEESCRSHRRNDQRMD